MPLYCSSCGACDGVKPNHKIFCLVVFFATFFVDLLTRIVVAQGTNMLIGGFLLRLKNDFKFIARKGVWNTTIQPAKDLKETSLYYKGRPCWLVPTSIE